LVTNTAALGAAARPPRRLPETIASQPEDIQPENQAMTATKIVRHRSSSQEFVITRVFDAPRELVWKAWTEREGLMQWFAAEGFQDAGGQPRLRPVGSFTTAWSRDGKGCGGKFVSADRQAGADRA